MLGVFNLYGNWKLKFFELIMIFLSKLRELALKLFLDEYSLQIYDAIKDIEYKNKNKMKVLVVGEVSNFLIDYINKRHELNLIKDVNDLDSIDIKNYDLFVCIKEKDNEVYDSKIISAIKSSNSYIFVNPTTDHLLLALKKASSTSIKEYLEQSSQYFRFTAKGLIGIYYKGISPSDDHNFWLLFGLLLCCMGVFNNFFFITYPHDDLLRHLVAYKYDYDYSRVYPDTWLFNGYRIYLGFDEIYGFLHKTFNDYSIPIVQSLALILYTLVFFFFMKKHVKKDGLLIIVIFLYLAAVLNPRFLLGRPSIFVSLLFVVSLLIPNTIISVVLGLLIVITYYFWPMYIILLIFNRREHILTLLIGFLFWNWISSGTYVHDLIYFITETEKNEYTFPIYELSSLIGTTIQSGYYLIPLVLYAYFGDRKYLLIVLATLALNKIRFIEYLFPLILFTLNYDKVSSYFRNFNTRVILVCALLIFSYLFYLKSFVDSFDLGLKYDNNKIFTDMMQISYRTVYESENVKLTPGPSIATLNTDQYKNMKLLLQNGTIDCDFIKKHNYTLVIEKSLKEFPECLELEELKREFRVWRVKNTSGTLNSSKTG
ncbi:MAG: hypothetical protein N3E37_02555 [Candidatus Micrarchaeota archaeon]|nr:hypothetical protein [Candidatus Micrarchaeota archaeon]